MIELTGTRLKCRPAGDFDLLLRCMSCDVQPPLRTGLAVCLFAYVSQFFVSPNASLILDKTAANHWEVYSNINCSSSCDNSGDKKTLSKNIWLYENIIYLFIFLLQSP